MKFLLETILFVVIMSQINLLSGLFQQQTVDNTRLRQQVAFYEQTDHLMDKARQQADLMIALR